MSGNGIFGIGTSALLAYQRALQVTGHNIANIGTEGYSRQRIDLSTRTALPSGFGALGNGVTTTGVDRVVDRFVELRLGLGTSAESYERTYAEFAAQIDNLLADPDAGLTPALGRFFAAVQDVATDPTSVAARQQLITEGQALTDRFAQLEGRIEDQRVIANGRIGTAVQEINQLAAGIADLNKQIVAARGRSGGEPNDLLDRRDLLLREIAERVTVNTVEQSDGSINVYVGRGQAIVVGLESTPLFVQPDGADPGRLDIGFRNGAVFVPVTDSLTGGRLGALLDVHDGLFDPGSNGLGRIAIALTELFNETHAAGMDLRGERGAAFFGRPDPEVLADRNNTAAGMPALAIESVADLAATDYELRFDGTAWSLRRLTDDQQVATVPPGGALDFDGLSLDLAGVTGAAAGDRFVLRPLRGVDRIEVRIGDPRAIAAALPVRAGAAAANTGLASVNSLTVVDGTDPALGDAVDVEFTGGNFVAGAVVVPLDPSGDTTVDINGWRLVVRGAPAEGDLFNVRSNAGGVGDNRGALALASLADRRELTGGSATLAESYAEVVAGIGVKARRATINADVQARLLADAKSQRESLSGVNLDEEAANLMRYQQAYQAAAQVIAVAGNVFDTLLMAVRR